MHGFRRADRQSCACPSRRFVLIWRSVCGRQKKKFYREINMIYKSNTSNHICLTLIVYTVCYGSFALVSVPFWDDWVLLQYGVDGLWGLFEQLGRREHYLLTIPFVAWDNPIVWAMTNFVLWGTVPLCVYAVLRGLGWAPGNAFWAAVLTAAAPLNQARFALAVTTYAFSAAFFALGLVVLIAAVKRRNIWLRVLAAVLLVSALPTNSFLTMMALAPTVVFLTLRNMDAEKRFWSAVRGTLWHIELFILPVAYWVIKTLFQQPFGLYAGYNSFRMGKLESVVGTIFAFIAQFPDVFVFFPTTGHVIEAVVLGLVVMLALAALVRLTQTNVATEQRAPWRRWLLFGALVGFSLLAIFPYVAVGIRPSFYALWDSRHQTTLSIVAGTLVFTFLQAVLPRRAVPVGGAVALLFFMALDFSASRQLLADVYDTNAIIYSPEIAEIPDGTYVGVFEDNRSYRMMMRHFQFYDLSGMVNALSPEKTLVAMSSYEVWDPKTDEYVLPGSEAFPRAIADTCQRIVGLPQYGFGDVVSSGQFAEVRLMPTSPPPGLLEGLGNALGFLFNRQPTIDKAVAELDVSVALRPFTEMVCPLPDAS